MFSCSFSVDTRATTSSPIRQVEFFTAAWNWTLHPAALDWIWVVPLNIWDWVCPRRKSFAALPALNYVGKANAQEEGHAWIQILFRWSYMLEGSSLNCINTADTVFQPSVVLTDFSLLVIRITFHLIILASIYVMEYTTKHVL